eukprot:12811278-Alexandrium_andersonii.AAC.2
MSASLVGSEMCIRDSAQGLESTEVGGPEASAPRAGGSTLRAAPPEPRFTTQGSSTSLDSDSKTFEP